MEEGYNKKARFEDKYLEESKEREKGFAVNLEAIKTPLRGKRSSRITTAKKALKIAKTPSNVASTKKKEREESYIRGSSIGPLTTGGR